MRGEQDNETSKGRELKSTVKNKFGENKILDFLVSGGWGGKKRAWIRG